jgi:hypothetical protein
MDASDLLLLLGAIALAILTVIVVRFRHRSHAAEVNALAERNVCEHLRPAWALLRSRGHVALRVGQKTPDLPLEIHVAPQFDPNAVYAELNLAEPVFVSERNVLYCKADWCEIHPVTG